MLRVKRPVYHRRLFEGGKACLPSGEAFIRSIVLKPHHNFSVSEVRVRMPWRDTVRPSREDKVRDIENVSEPSYGEVLQLAEKQLLY